MGRGIWRNRSFVFYLIGQTISSLGDGFYLIAFMWLALQLSGGKGLVLGGIFSIYTLNGVIFGFIAGPIADKFNKKKILIIVDILRGVVVLILFILVRFNVASILHLYIITFAFSVCSPFFHRTEFTIIPQLVPKEILLKANGIISGARRLMQIISPGFGGVLISSVGIENCFLIDTITFFFSSFCIVFVVVRYSVQSKEALKIRSFFANIKEGYRLLIGSSFLLTLAIYAACINFLGGPIMPLLPLLATKHGMEASGYGIMMSVLSIGLITSSFLVGFLEKILRRVPMILTGLIISAIAILIMGIGFMPIAILIALFFLGIGLSLSNLPINTLFQEKVSPDKLGVVSSFVFTIAQIALPISIALSGFLVDFVSLGTIFTAVGIMLLVGAMIGFALPQFKGESTVIGAGI
ncbi:MAG: MFS transporter [bacterium]